MKRSVLVFLFLNVFIFLFGQDHIPDRLASLFFDQLTLFPQEKIYVHTDKPYYVAGEKIWFRAYLADAVMHIPTSVSRYVYVELINPLDSVVTRVKIRETEEAYHGHLTVPADAPQGDYTLRAYTAFMLNQDEHDFFTKTIHIGNLRTGATAASTPLIAASPLDDDFDVSFYPEGGHLISGTIGKVAFRALKSDGHSLEVSGTIFDQSGAIVTTFKSSYLGMGVFMLLPEKGKSYYAICEDDLGRSKHFPVPLAVDFGYALSVGLSKERLTVSVNKSAETVQNSELYLLAHTRGMIHFIDLWDHEKETLLLYKDMFPSGVLHLILFDASYHPLSERVVFIQNQDQAQIKYQPDRESYAKRSLIKNKVTITDSDGQALSGSFSVAITSDREVTVDSTANILTRLLLTSDLRGEIENPAYYFQQKPQSDAALNLLMLTQGWRRYNISELAQGHFSQPASPLETGAEISGSVKNVLMGRPIEHAEVTVVSLSQTNDFYNTAHTDKEGRFSLPIKESPDSTRFMVSVEPIRGLTRMELILNKEHFPERTLYSVSPVEVDKNRFVLYADKTEQQYVYEEGIRITQLEAAVVTAQRQSLRKSQYYTTPDNSLTEEQIERIPVQTVFQLLERIPGIQVVRSTQDSNGVTYTVTLRGSTTFVNRREDMLGNVTNDLPPPLLIVDDIAMDFSYLDMMNVRDIAQVDVLKNPDKTSIFGVRGGNGVIVIHTKKGRNINDNRTESAHIKIMMPLGYQQPVEFYAPKYDTSEKVNAFTRDLRTTIHWQPVVQTDSRGVASFEFYTADEQTSYTVVIEGLAEDGSIIRHQATLWQKEER